jgi:voltage-dependent potassium channel beta subunit
MQYRQLGRAGLKVSELSFGSWVTFSKQINAKEIKQLMQLAFEQGVNFFDNAEAYAAGEAETLMGEALKSFQRSDVVVSTKIFWGGQGPNDVGLSRKHLLEGTKRSLKRLNLDYVDLLFCHRPDPTTPIAETVLAMDYLVRQGYVLYWGTSEWSAEQITQAYQLAKELNAIPPSMEQPEYNLFQRQRVEQEYQTLYEQYGLGTTIWSPLASGVLTGKYQNNIPADSRLAKEAWLIKPDMAERLQKVAQLQKIAAELGITVAQLAIAWCLKNSNVSSVILGASRSVQLQENLQASEIKTLLTADVMGEIEKIV